MKVLIYIIALILLSVFATEIIGVNVKDYIIGFVFGVILQKLYDNIKS